MEAHLYFIYPHQNFASKISLEENISLNPNDYSFISIIQKILLIKQCQYQLIICKSRMQGSLSTEQLYKIIPQLKISPKGVFKYILIKCSEDGKLIGTFVRGDERFEYHSQNFDQFFKELKKNGFTQLKKKQEKIFATRNGQKFQFKCPGGGRIEHQHEGKKCSIYGYSQSYGYVDHSQAQKIISLHLGYNPSEIQLNQKQY